MGHEDGEDSFDEEITDVKESLVKIEAIMVAENKRRIDSNQIMQVFIKDYIKTLNETITSKVDTDF